MTTQIATDTELSAVNSILGSIGQSPINAINANTLLNPEIALIQNILTETNKDVQNEKWHFNTELRVPMDPDSNKHINVPIDAISIDISDGQADRMTDVVIRDNKLYDLVKETNKYEFESKVYLDIVRLLPFNQVPPPIQRYIIAKASVRAAVEIVSNADLVKLLQANLERSLATALEHDCQQGDHNYMGWQHQSTYRSYQPYKALIR